MEVIDGIAGILRAGNLRDGNERHSVKKNYLYNYNSYYKRCCSTTQEDIYNKNQHNWITYACRKSADISADTNYRIICRSFLNKDSNHNFTPTLCTEIFLLTKQMTLVGIGCLSRESFEGRCSDVKMIQKGGRKVSEFLLVGNKS